MSSLNLGTNLCGFLSQLWTGSISLYQVLHGISRWILPLGLGASAVPTRLYIRPVPSGRGKNMEPWCFLPSDVIVIGKYVSSYCLVCWGSTMKDTGPLHCSPSMIGFRCHDWLLRFGMLRFFVSFTLTLVAKCWPSRTGGLPMHMPVKVKVTGVCGPPSRKQRSFCNTELNFNT